MLISLAWRNLWRAPRRTGITLFSIAFGAWLAASFTALGDNSYRNMIQSSARLGFGHATVEPTGSRDAPGFDRWVADAEGRAATIKADPLVSRVSVRIFGQAMFATARKTVGGVLYGVDPNREDGDINIYLQNLVEGRTLADAGARETVVGIVLAEKLGLKLGKKLVYTVVDTSGELVSEVVRVRGIFETGVDEVDGSVALLPIDRVRALLGYQESDASMISIYVDDHRSAPAVVERVKGSLGASCGLTVATWSDTQPELAGMVRLDRGMNQLFQLLIGVLIAAGVLNTLLMSVLERRKEFGVMLALGTAPSFVFRLVMLESSLMALVGIATSVLALVPWFHWLQTTGIDTREMTGEVGVAGVLVDPVLRATIYPESMLSIGLFVFLLSVGAGLYPAWRAGRERPVDVLHGD